jgi:hypothetical protein
VGMRVCVCVCDGLCKRVCGLRRPGVMACTQVTAMAGSLQEASEVVHARQCIGAPGGNRGVCNLVRYLPDLGHALRTLMLTPLMHLLFGASQRSMDARRPGSRTFPVKKASTACGSPSAIRH